MNFKIFLLKGCFLALFIGFLNAQENFDPSDLSNRLSCERFSDEEIGLLEDTEPCRGHFALRRGVRQQNKNANNQQDLLVFRQQITLFKDYNNDLQQEIKELEDEQQNLESKIKCLTKERDEFKKVMTDLYKQNDRLRNHNTVLQQERDLFFSQAQGLMTTVVQQQNLLQQYGSNFQQLLPTMVYTQILSQVPMHLDRFYQQVCCFDLAVLPENEHLPINSFKTFYQKRGIGQLNQLDMGRLLELSNALINVQQQYYLATCMLCNRYLYQ